MPDNPYGYEHQQARKRALKMLRDGVDCCWRCGRPMYRRQRLHLDHVNPVAIYGPNNNYRLVHARCNERAGARMGNRLRRRRAGIPHPSNKRTPPKRQLPRWLGITKGFRPSLPFVGIPTGPD